MGTYTDLVGGLTGGNLGVSINSGGTAPPNTPTPGNDTLTGNSGDNILDGGPGADTMMGGAGNDSYYVDNPNDAVYEDKVGGTDIVFSTVSYAIGKEVENLTLLGTTAVYGTGNGLNNTITGNEIGNDLSGLDGDDLLQGMGGNDILSGGEGKDTLVGGDGNDTLYGYYPLHKYPEDLIADTLMGGKGDDIYYLSSSVTDIIYENPDEGYDTIRSMASVLLTPPNVEAVELIGPGMLSAVGNSLDNRLVGNSYMNTLDGGAGNDTLDGGRDGQADTLIGGTGDDTYLVSEVEKIVEYAGEGIDTVIFAPDGGRLNSYETILTFLTLVDQIENIVLRGVAEGARGNDEANIMTGNDLANRLYGMGGNDTVDGGGGADWLEGGAGDDTYVVDNADDKVVEGRDQGRDTVRARVGYTLSDNVENLTLEDAARLGIGNGLDNIIRGGQGSDVLVGLGGADRLEGGAGDDALYSSSRDNTLLDDGTIDTLVGGAGNDSYYVTSSGDIVQELGNEGVDTVYSSVSILRLAANVEKLVLLGSAEKAIGNELLNTLTGNSADNILDGGSGADILYGGNGNDTYEIDNLYDRVFENINEGTDEVRFGVYMGSLERLADNVENITLVNYSANATGNGLDNRIIGNALPNILTGGDGNDWLDGGAGFDSLIGGRGDDVYVVDNAAETPREYVGEGVDTVRSSVAFSLGDNLENLVLTGTNSINAYGNGLNNNITGNDAANTLVGGGGDDVLDGGRGADIMGGGLGSDRYWVDNIGDRVVEDAVEKPLAIARIDAERPDWLGNYRSILGLNAFDWVFSTIDYTLSDTSNIEVLALRGVASVSATGNNLDNGITGNGGNNTLKGLDGNDALWGGAGADILEGGDGDDWLDGGYGHDVLTGGAGRDVFDFGENFPVDPATGKVSGSTLSSSHDVVRDFVHGEDKIALSMKTFAAFAGHRPGDGIAAGQIRIVTSTEKWDVSFASDRDDYLIYDRFTGKLWYDGNGSDSVNDELGLWSGKRLIATFSSADGLHPQTLDHTDFMLIA